MAQNMTLDDMIREIRTIVESPGRGAEQDVRLTELERMSYTAPATRVDTYEQFDRFEEHIAADVDESDMPIAEQSVLFRLRKRAEIRRQISGRKSVQEGAPDRIADLLDEAADEIARLQGALSS
jgi:hypothetical protein